jgi:tetratricopeptide (TPR) repeat protein
MKSYINTVIFLFFSSTSFSQKVIFFDSFDDNKQNWEISNNERESAKIADGKYILKTFDEDIWHWFTKEIKLDRNKNVSLEANIILNKYSNNNSNFGVVFGGADQSNNFQILYSPQYNRIYGYALQNGKYYQLFDAIDNIKLLSNTGKFKIVFTNEDCSFYFNERLMVKTKPISFLGAKTGFIVSVKTEISVTDIVIKENLVKSTNITSENLAKNGNIFICGYGEKNLSKDICNVFNVKPLFIDQQAEDAVDKILTPLGLPHNFVLVSCPNIKNAIALTPNDGIRYIVYDKEFISGVYKQNSKWYSLSILAHEIGHHLCGHTLLQSKDLVEQKKKEIEADEFSGFILSKLGATLQEAQSAVVINSNNEDDSYSTHPSLNKRLLAIERGFLKAQGKEPIVNITTEESAESIFQKAKTFQISGKLEQALMLYNKVIEIDSKFYKAYNNRGICKSDKGDYQGAIEDYSISISIFSSSNAYCNRGNCYRIIKKYDLAMADLNLALVLDNDNAVASEDRAILMAAMDRHQDAILDFDKALSLSSDWNIIEKSNCYFYRGYSKKILGDKYGALQDFTKAISLNNDNEKAYLYRGKMYAADRQQLDLAIADLSNVIRINPMNDEAYAIRANTYGVKSDYYSEMNDSQSALSINPNNGLAHQTKGFALDYFRKYTESCQSFQLACDLGLKISCEWIRDNCR